MLGGLFSYLYRSYSKIYGMHVAEINCTYKITFKMKCPAKAIESCTCIIFAITFNYFADFWNICLASCIDRSTRFGWIINKCYASQIPFSTNKLRHKSMGIAQFGKNMKHQMFEFCENYKIISNFVHVLNLFFFNFCNSRQTLALLKRLWYTIYKICKQVFIPFGMYEHRYSIHEIDHIIIVPKYNTHYQSNKAKL